MPKDPVYGDLDMGFLDPCPLTTLAEALRDGTWLDVRTDEHTIMRVRIIEIVVRTQGEDVVFRQEWLDSEQEFQKAQFAIDSDAIWRIVKSSYKVDEVMPYEYAPSAHVAKRVSNGEERRIIDAVNSSACYLFQEDPKEFVSNYGGKGTWNLVNHRHVAIIVIYEMTNMSPTAICTKAYGYKSQGPWLTAAWKAKVGPGRDSKAFCDSVRRLGELVDSKLCERFRRSDRFGHDYQPVLSR